MGVLIIIIYNKKEKKTTTGLIQVGLIVFTTEYRSFNIDNFLTHAYTMIYA